MYELVAQLLEPYTFLLIASALAIGWAWRSSTRPHSRSLVVASVLVGVLVVLSTPLVGDFALGSLEWPYPPTVESPDAADTIVVLGGSMIAEDVAAARARLGNATITRCLHAARMYKQAGHCRIITAGGRIVPSLPQVSLAAVMRDFLVDLGVHTKDIVMEEESATTFENVALLMPMLEPVGDSRIWLVTEATHMRRAEKCFRARGVRVTPAPCGHHALLIEYEVRTFLPTSDGIARVDQAAHEWLGILWYWIRGRI